MGALARAILLLTFCSLFSQASLALRIAEQKCLEYRNLTIKSTPIVALTAIGVPEDVQHFDCSKTVDLIVGGSDAAPGEFPHQALLGYPSKDNPDEYTFDCGGSLISEDYVLTAGHCFKYGNATIVRLAEKSLQNDWDDQVDIEIDSIIRHPSYLFKKAYHDIALVKLKERIKQFTMFIRPACLWTGPELNFTTVIATGYGSNGTDGLAKSDVLQKVELDVLDSSVCSQKVLHQRQFPQGFKDSQLCIGSHVPEKDTCLGDSGGPVQVLTEPKGCIYHVVGVTSTSAGTCGNDKPAAIYTKVSSYIDWIERVVWE